MTGFPYEDIINHKYVKNKNRECMSITDRAAQFSRFAAVVGHDLSIEETARITEKKKELDEYEMEELRNKLNLICSPDVKELEVKITYFVPDDKKEGGRYEEFEGFVIKTDEVHNLLITNKGDRIPVTDIVKIDIEKNENNIF